VALMVSIVEATTVKKPEAVTKVKMYKEVPLRMNILLQQYRQEQPSVVRSDRVLYRQGSTVTILRSGFKKVSLPQEQLWRITLKVLIAIQHCFKVATVVRQGGHRVQWERYQMIVHRRELHRILNVVRKTAQEFLRSVFNTVRNLPQEIFKAFNDVRNLSQQFFKVVHFTVKIQRQRFPKELSMLNIHTREHHQDALSELRTISATMQIKLLVVIWTRDRTRGTVTTWPRQDLRADLHHGSPTVPQESNLRVNFED